MDVKKKFQQYKEQLFLKFKFRGKGVDDEKTGRKGDMYGIIKVIIPTKLDREQKKLFKSLSETKLDTDAEFKKYNKYTED